MTVNEDFIKWDELPKPYKKPLFNDKEEAYIAGRKKALEDADKVLHSLKHHPTWKRQGSLSDKAIKYIDIELKKLNETTK